MKLKTVTIGGASYPVHFGFAALLEINKLCGVDKSNFLSAFNLTDPENRIKVAQIGMKEGFRLMGSGIEVPEDIGAFCDLLDQRPESLEEILGVFYLQTFGEDKQIEKLDNLIEKSQAAIDATNKELGKNNLSDKDKQSLEEVKEASASMKNTAELAKNQYPMLIEPAKGLASVESMK